MPLLLRYYGLQQCMAATHSTALEHSLLTMQPLLSLPSWGWATAGAPMGYSQQGCACMFCAQQRLQCHSISGEGWQRKTLRQKAAKPAGSLAGPWLCPPASSKVTSVESFIFSSVLPFSDMLFCIKKSCHSDCSSLLPLLNVAPLSSTLVIYTSKPALCQYSSGNRFL